MASAPDTLKFSFLARSHECGQKNRSLAMSRSGVAGILGTNYTQEIKLVWFACLAISV